MMLLVELMMNVIVFLADDGLECGTVISTDSSVAQVDSVLRCQTSQHQHSLSIGSIRVPHTGDILHRAQSVSIMKSLIF